MKSALPILALAICILLCSCYNSKPHGCEELNKISIDLQYRTLDFVKANVRGHWKIHSIEGGLCQECHPIPANNSIVITDTHLLWTQADTIVYDREIQWSHVTNSDKWSMGVGLTVDRIDEGILFLNFDMVAVDGIGYTLERDCDHVE